ncbi:hypothetical protein [Thalassolituus oleivorans]|uniref:hypothetical protein n=1 Tax=Thalassolituus oleivorans TaxID=187493 RepID=UPI00240A7A2A|nr:hypothetical protein [Thalassolituus oleivorans]MDF1642198.1 hypothetical protein [Thalassolituus oleivorans]
MPVRLGLPPYPQAENKSRQTISATPNLNESYGFITVGGTQGAPASSAEDVFVFRDDEQKAFVESRSYT